ncbi:hypothetical protein BKA65DRAFT_473385 [Rhexocercosporidium sp. MPI-PUGE-AT-0058]|nr:hypothetical protein BKA65DRAFT_473385 [Rhexocercosporidium sp. MPI-PUGE-AT-0058]
MKINFFTLFTLSQAAGVLSAAVEDRAMQSRPKASSSITDQLHPMSRLIHLLFQTLLRGHWQPEPAGPDLAMAVAKMDGAGRCAAIAGSGAGHLKARKEIRNGRLAPIGGSAA